MSNVRIWCFNGDEATETGECIYEKCPMYSQEIDTCKLELLKIHVKQVKTPRRAPAPVKETTTQLGGARLISSLQEGEKSSKQTPISIKGTLMFDPIQRDFARKDGTTGSVTNITLKDESGECKITFWDDAGKEIMDFVKDDKLFFEGLFKVEAPYGDKPQINAGKYYKVAKLN